MGMREGPLMRLETRRCCRRIKRNMPAILVAACVLCFMHTSICGGPAASSDAVAQPTASAVRIEAVLRTARNAVAARPDDEMPVRNLVEALMRFGQKVEALAEADRFLKRGRASAALYAQRGFIRTGMNDLRGAAEDLSASIAGGLVGDQLRNVQAALSDIRSVELQGKLDRAQEALTRGDFVQASEQAAGILANNPKSEPAMRIRVEALARGGQKRDALADVDQFVKQGASGPDMLAQRGFLRRELSDTRGALEDFAAARGGEGLTPDQRSNVEAALTEAQTAILQEQIARAEAALKRKDYLTASKESREAVQRDPNSEAAIRIRMDTLASMGRKGEAVTESNQFVAANPGSALQAQRGFLRRELQDKPGAISDFKAVLAGISLTEEQRRNVQRALVEAQQASLPTAAANNAPPDLNSESAIRNRMDVLMRAGRKREAMVEADRLIARGQAQGWIYAQRGFSRFDSDHFKGAVEDFDAALGRRDLDAKAIPSVRYTRSVAAAKLAERDNKPGEAEAIYRAFLQTNSSSPDGWYNLGYLLLKQRRRREGADALNAGLELRPVGAAYLDAANGYIPTNAPLASRLYRLGLDRWYSGDTSLAKRTQTDLERIKNEVVEADASLRSSIGVGGITARPESAGGNNLFAGAESSVRFDGRYLPVATGFEAFARGFTGKDANGIRETASAAGLRYRPFDGINFYVSGALEHFFKPTSYTQPVLNWGLSFGADPYPYEVDGSCIGISGPSAHGGLRTSGCWKIPAPISATFTNF